MPARTHAISTYWSATEQTRIAAVAREEGISPGAAVRHLALLGLKSRKAGERISPSKQERTRPATMHYHHYPADAVITRLPAAASREGWKTGKRAAILGAARTGTTVAEFLAKPDCAPRHLHHFLQEGWIKLTSPSGLEVW